MYGERPEAKRKLLRVSGKLILAIEGSSYQGQNCSTRMMEIQGKSILVQVSTRF